MIKIANLRRTYGKKTAVECLNLEIAPGEVFAFLGPNGAGKTTTIKTMVGLLKPTSGQVTIAGVDAVADPRGANRQIGYVPDQPHLYDKLTGRELLEFVARMYGLTPAETRESIARQIRAFELEEFVDRLAESYSHGMKQRLVFATALVHQPRVLIVDEPMVGLDPRSMRLVKDLLLREAQQGATVFMSTHTLSVAEEIAARLAIINHGKLLFLGTVAELRSHLANEHSSLEQLYLEITSSDDAGRTIIPPPADASRGGSPPDSPRSPGSELAAANGESRPADARTAGGNMATDAPTSSSGS